MKIDVYDTYAKSKQGHIMHFDVLVPHGTSPNQAFAYAQEWLIETDEDAQGLDQSRCNFCHSENSHPEIQALIHKRGYYILKMEGCF